MSSATLNFQLRPNKSIGRKLIFGALGTLEGAFDLREYAYVGFGSYWFTDLVMAHKRLLIRDLVSIEVDASVVPRARANAPFAHVEVRQGLSTTELPEVLKTRNRVIAWLDYDGEANEVVTSDISILTDRAPNGSVILVTVNAHPRKFGHSESSQEARLREVFPEAPTPLGMGFFQKPLDQFPSRVARLLLERMARGVSSRIGHTFVPLFNMAYQDGAPMVTVGGIIIRKSQDANLRRTRIYERAGVTGWTQYLIDAPTLTRREKLALDRLLPRASIGCTKDEMRRAGLATVEDEGDVAVYAQLLSRYAPVYREYPVYSEFDL